MPLAAVGATTRCGCGTAFVVGELARWLVACPTCRQDHQFQLHHPTPAMLRFECAKCAQRFSAAEPAEGSERTLPRQPVMFFGSTAGPQLSGSVLKLTPLEPGAAPREPLPTLPPQGQPVRCLACGTTSTVPRADPSRASAGQPSQCPTCRRDLPLPRLMVPCPRCATTFVLEAPELVRAAGEGEPLQCTRCQEVFTLPTSRPDVTVQAQGAQVQCPRCATTFQLDAPAQVRAAREGAPLQCTRCQETFTLPVQENAAQARCSRCARPFQRDQAGLATGAPPLCPQCQAGTAPPAPEDPPELQQAWRLLSERPDEDAARLVLADALLALGDPQGELITIQVGAGGKRPTGLAKLRERELLRLHRSDWEPRGTQQCVFRRGLLTEAMLVGPTDLSHRGWRSVESLAMGSERQLPLPPLPALTRLVGLPTTQLTSLLASGARLTELGLVGLRGAVDHLPTVLPRLPALRSLTVRGGAAEPLEDDLYTRLVALAEARVEVLRILPMTSPFIPFTGLATLRARSRRTPPAFRLEVQLSPDLLFRLDAGEVRTQLRRRSPRWVVQQAQQALRSCRLEQAQVSLVDEQGAELRRAWVELGADWPLDLTER